MNRKGFSLLQMMVGLGITGVAMYGGMELAKNQVKTQNYISTNSELQTRVNFVTKLLSNVNLCTCNLAPDQQTPYLAPYTFNPNDPDVKVDLNHGISMWTFDCSSKANDILKLNEKITSSGELTSIELTDIFEVDPGGKKYSGTIEFKVTRSNSAGGKILTQKVPIFFRTTLTGVGNDEQIVSCNLDDSGGGLTTGVGGYNAAGQVGAFASSDCPSGWILADGSTVSRSDYSNLFDRIGVIYGAGNGSTTFRLPDYRGYFLRGVSGSTGRDPNKGSRLNRGDGLGGNRVGTIQSDEFREHRHDYHDKWKARRNNPKTVKSQANPDVVVQEKVEGTDRRTDKEGGNETRPKNIYVQYCIKI